jgi:dihydrofolate reductase
VGNLIYSMLVSLDGYVEEADGNFDWAQPDEQVFTFINDLERSVGTHLYGRRLYEVMAPWETDPALGASSPHAAAFADIWKAADKVVYSRTLSQTSTARTQMEREFDPGQVRELKAGAAQDLTVGGPELAAHAIRAGLVDEIHQFVAPIVVGGGKPLLPTGVRVGLELLDERRFDNGMVFLRYRTSA